MCRTASAHFEYIRIFLMTSPDHLKMAPTCGTPFFDIFWEFFIRNYVKIRRKSVKNVANDRKFILLFVYNPNRMSTFFLLSFLRAKTLPPLAKTSKNCLHLPMENGVFLLETDGGKYSSFGTICLNEGIKETSKKK